MAEDIELIEKEAKNYARKVQGKVKNLGDSLEKLYDNLYELQGSLNHIQNISDESQLKYKKLLEVSSDWRQKAKKIEKDLKNSVLDPTAAMGIATTFGVASTGTAISSLSWVVVTRAAIAWLGGGTQAAGKALLFLFGPIGWGIAGLSFLDFFFDWLDADRFKSICIRIHDRDINISKRAVKELDARIFYIEYTNNELLNCILEMSKFETDYSKMSKFQQNRLSYYIDLMETAIGFLVNPIWSANPIYTEEDYRNFIHDKLSIDDCCEDKKELIINLANLLYKIKLDDDDKRVLIKSLKEDKEFLEVSHIEKDMLDVKDIDTAEEALRSKYGDMD